MRQFVSGTRPMTTPDVIAAPFISHATAEPRRRAAISNQACRRRRCRKRCAIILVDGSHYSQSAHVALQGKAHFIAEAVSAGVKKDTCRPSISPWHCRCFAVLTQRVQRTVMHRCSRIANARERLTETAK